MGPGRLAPLSARSAAASAAVHAALLAAAAAAGGLERPAPDLGAPARVLPAPLAASDPLERAPAEPRRVVEAEPAAPLTDDPALALPPEPLPVEPLDEPSVARALPDARPLARPPRDRTREGVAFPAPGAAASGAPEREAAPSEPAREPAVLVDGDPPRYPPLSIRLGEEGTVRCRIEIAPDGTVSAASVLRSSGHARLDAAALEAIRGWRFRPARRGGAAVPDALEHDVVFRLVDG